MRIKLVFEFLPRYSKQNKICFHLDKQTCKHISDLNYLIQKRYFDNKGTVSLYLPDDFYFPPQETIDLIQENDMLHVKFFPRGNENEEKDKKACLQRKRKLSETTEESSLSSSSSESSEEEIKTKKYKKAKKHTTAKPLYGDRKTVPISKLGIVQNKKKVSSSSESSTSSSSDSSDDECPVKTTTKKNGKSIDHVFKKPLGIKGNVLPKKINKICTPHVKTSATQSKKKSSDSGSSDSSDGDRTQNTGKSKIDFHVSNLSKNAISTPGNSFVNKQNTSIGSKVDFTSHIGSTSENKKNFALNLATKDVYKNVSQVLTSGETAEKNNNTTDYNKSSNDANNISLETSINSESNSSISKTDFSTEPPISGKTLRNRRRRQRLLEAKNRSKSTTGADENANKFVATKKINKITVHDVGPSSTNANHQNSMGTNGCSKQQMNGVSNTDIQMTPSTSTQSLNGEVKHSSVQSKDYLTYPEIQKPPPISSLIAFKLLELDSTYQPYVTDYRVATLITCDSGSVTLQLNEEFKNTRSKMKGKFDLETDVEEIDDLKVGMICKQWTEILEPRLIHSSSISLSSNAKC